MKFLGLHPLLNCFSVFYIFIICFLFSTLSWYLRLENKVLVQWPILGSLPSILRNAHRIHEWTVEISNTIGRTRFEKGPFLGRLDLLFTCDPRNVEYIVKTNFPNFHKGPNFEEMFDILGKGILTADSDHWHEQRKLANITFASKDFRKFIGDVNEKVIEKELVPLLAHLAREKTVVDMEDVFLRFTFDAIFTVVFGSVHNLLNISFPSNDLSDAMDHATEALFYRHVVPSAWWKLCRWLGVGREGQLKHAWKTIDRYMEHYISSKREELLRGVEATDLLAAYMSSIDLKNSEKLPSDDKFLRDTMLSFLFAGRESSAMSLSWFLWLVAKTPDVEEKILQELRLVHTTKNLKIADTDTGYVFGSEDVKGLVYLQATLHESLRLYPPIPITRKAAIEKDVLPDGTVVKPGMKILISLYAMGRIEKIWGKDCLKFKPERWIDEDGKLSRLHMSNFFTFHTGPRNCVARDMSFIQMKLVAAAILFNFHVELVEGHEVLSKPSANLRMKNGLLVRIKERLV